MEKKKKKLKKCTQNARPVAVICNSHKCALLGLNEIFFLVYCGDVWAAKLG
jgi:hypothetical protein